MDNRRVINCVLWRFRTGTPCLERCEPALYALRSLCSVAAGRCLDAGSMACDSDILTTDGSCVRLRHCALFRHWSERRLGDRLGSRPEETGADPQLDCAKVGSGYKTVRRGFGPTADTERDPVERRIAPFEACLRQSVPDARTSRRKASCARSAISGAATRPRRLPTRREPGAAPGLRAARRDAAGAPGTGRGGRDHHRARPCPDALVGLGRSRARARVLGPLLRLPGPVDCSPMPFAAFEAVGGILFDCIKTATNGTGRPLMGC